MAPTITDPLLGRMVDGRYEVVERIARGGMATVYRAIDRRLERHVALKVMHPHLAEGAEGAAFVARFRREARAAARLTHPGLVGVFDQGLDGETSYLTMEYVDGTNLRRRIADPDGMTVAETLTVLEAVLDALASAHRAGLVHRDVKPENVLLAADGRVKVADFGLARAVTEVTSTTTGTVLGTVAYLSPELVAHGVSDARTDVYAAGILLYEMLTGRQPFTGATAVQVAYQHVNSDVPPPSDLVEWLPMEVDELVAALAARDPQDRPEHAGAALALLRRTRAVLDPALLERRVGRAVVPAPRTSPESSGPPSPDSGQVLRGPDGVAAGSGPLALTTSVGASDDATPHAGPPGSPDAVTAALEMDAPGRTIALPIGAVAAQAAPSSPEAPGDSGQRPRRRRRWWLWVLLTVGVLAAAGATTFWYVTAGPAAYTTVPAVVGAPLAEAEASLDAANLAWDVTEVYHDDAPEGTVVGSDPPPGHQIRKDGAVGLEVSRGPRMLTVPEDVVGATVGIALGMLEEAGFTVGDPVREYDNEVPEDAVISVTPGEGETVRHDTVVQLVVSQGPEPVTVPQVVGADEETAIRDLARYGLDADVERTHSMDVAAGRVISQDPEQQTEARWGDTVTLVVSLGPPLVEVPDVVGTQLREARHVLEELGLEVEVREVLGGYFGTVRNQSERPGSEVPKGSTVTLTVV